MAGFSEAVVANDKFGFEFQDLSKSLGQVDYATISFRPDPDSEVGARAVRPPIRASPYPGESIGG